MFLRLDAVVIHTVSNRTSFKKTTEEKILASVRRLKVLAFIVPGQRDKHNWHILDLDT